MTPLFPRFFSDWVRAILSWIGACVVAGCVGAAIVSMISFVNGQTLALRDVALSAGAFCVGALVFTGPPTAALIWLIRISRIRRPWADTMAGAILAAATAFLFGSQHPPASLYYLMVPSGLSAGLAYWALTGRPRPPYVG